MDVLEAIRDRKSIRAYLDKPVDKQTIKSILNVARFSPSGVNIQPWKVIAVTNDMKDEIGKAIIDAREKGIPENKDYNYYPDEWFEPYKSRRKKCGLDLYSSLGITLKDSKERKVAWYKNYHFFYAPVGLLFFIDSRLDVGSWMDMGMFLQSVMLAARGHGLETCAQASMAEYPDIVRDILGVDNSQKLVCGLALGYPDLEKPVNQYRTDREEVSTFTNFIGFDD